MGFHDLERSERLLLARRGTDYFARHLAQLTDEQLDAATALEGWTRRHVVAHVSYNAAALCRLLDWAATGVETPMYESAEQRASEIEKGAALDAAALRNLFADSAARLDGKWRDLPDQAWNAQVRTAQGRTVPASETAWMRSREVWIHAVDLGNGAGFDGFPEAVLESLLSDIVTAWRSRGEGAGLVLHVEGNAPVGVGEGPQSSLVAGPLAAVVSWAAGRGGSGLTSAQADPPRWL